MKRDEVHRFLDTYLDGELDFARRNSESLGRNPRLQT